MFVCLCDETSEGVRKTIEGGYSSVVAGCLQVSRSEECGVRSRYQWHHKPPNAKHPPQKGTTCSALPVTPQTVRDLKTNDHVTKLKTGKTSH